MQHSIPVAQLGPRGESMARAVQTCVHCGFCLPTCPTYQVLGQEMDSPRGRIFLMKEVLEGKLDPAQAQPHIDRCLGCLACQTHCPSGVQYGELLSPYRAIRRAEGTVCGDPLRRWLASHTLSYPGRFRLAMLFGQLGKRLQGLVPRRLRPMVEMVPERIPRRVKLAEFTPAIGTRRGRVGLLSGCAQQVLAPEINLAAQRLLARNGYDVVLPRGQVCCGALHWHIGEDQRAQQFARENLRAFSGDLDAIITTAAGCGSAMHEYPLMLAGTKDEEAGRQLAAKAIDIAAFLDKVGLVPFPQRELPMTIRVAYHDACHLSHGQKVRSPPRELLRQVPGLELVELAETELCCGSAGTYNLDHPETATALGEQKARQVIDSNAEFLALGNIGCLIQLQNHLGRLGSSVKVVHTVQLLDQACHLTSAERVVNPK